MNQRGMTLVELLISMLLGLVIMAGISSVFQASRQTYRSNEGLTQIQESARTTFELLSRDLRQAGFTSCGSNKLANVLKRTASDPLLEWVGLQGFDGNTAAAPVLTGTAISQRVAGTSAILVQGMSGLGRSVAMHDAASAQFSLSAGTLNFVVGDFAIACDANQATLFQVYSNSTTAVTYGVSTASPGNCTIGLGYPTDCTTPNFYNYPPNAVIAPFFSAIWYIGNNGRADAGWHSLYRLRLDNGNKIVVEEMVAGVTDLQIQYHVRDIDAWSNAATVTANNDWSDVDAVSLNFILDSFDNSISTDKSVNGGRLQRSFTQIIALRNRIS